MFLNVRIHGKNNTKIKEIVGNWSGGLCSDRTTSPKSLQTCKMINSEISIGINEKSMKTNGNRWKYNEKQMTTIENGTHFSWITLKQKVAHAISMQNRHTNRLRAPRTSRNGRKPAKTHSQVGWRPSGPTWVLTGVVGRRGLKIELIIIVVYISKFFSKKNSDFSEWA